MDSAADLNKLKKNIFFEFLNLIGRVFILVRYSENVILGNRGFTAEEKDNGIILVFNSKMNFLWDDYGITVTLVFGTSPQKCFIPVEDIAAIYSPELNAQFTSSPQIKKSQNAIEKNKVKTEEINDRTAREAEQPQNVIKVDFTKKRK